MDRLVLSVLLSHFTSVAYTMSDSLCTIHADTSNDWNKGVPYIKKVISEEGCKIMCLNDNKCKAVTHYTVFGVETCSLYKKAHKEARPQSDEGLVAGIENKVFTKEGNCGKPIVWTIDQHTGKQYAQLTNGRFNSYSASKEMCHLIGGILPEPRDREENSFVAKMSSTRIWLGMNNKDVEGDWVWDSDNHRVKWLNWESLRRGTSQRYLSEPIGSGVRNCAMILKDAYTRKNVNYYTTTWDAFRCNATVSTVVCEKQRRWTSTYRPTGKEYTTMTDLRGSFNRTASKALCSSIGGILPEPRSKEENDFVASLSDTWFWLGMNDEDKEGRWVWESDNSCVRWNYWESWRQEKFAAEPSGLSEKNCAIIMNDIWPMSRYNSSAWATIRCEGSDIFVKEVVCEKEVCRTQGCVDAAESISRNLNTAVSPCDNMYEFSCGGWMQKNPIPDDKESISQSDLLGDRIRLIVKDLLETPDLEDDLESLKKIKAFYKSCMNTDLINEVGDSKMKAILTEEFGGWPIINSAWSEEDFSLMDTMLTLDSYGLTAVASLYVDTDLKNSTKHVLLIDQTFGSLGNGHQYYSVPRNDSLRLTLYQKWIEGVAILMGGATADVTVVEKDAADIVDFEVQLAKIMVPAEDRRYKDDLYNVQTLAEFHGNYSEVFDWRTYVKRVMGSPSVGVTDVTDEEKIINKSPSYFGNLTQLLKNTDNRILSNYLLWRFVRRYVDKIGEAYMNITAYRDWRNTWHSNTTKPPPFHSCITWSKWMSPLVLTRMFIDGGNFNPEAETTVHEMVVNLRATFGKILDKAEWMDEKTKLAARTKLDLMTLTIGYQEQIRNDSFLEELYANGTYSAEHFFENIVKIRREKYNSNRRKLRQPKDKNPSWNALYVNAHQFPTYNKMVFTAGILQPPYYSEYFPKYLSYGGIGFVIGHEITHGFDDGGRRLDGYGNLVNWWSESALSEFNKKKQCLIDQYSNMTMPGSNMTMNGVKSQGENIGDNGGLKESFMAYRKWVADRGGEEAVLPGLNYTQNQLFFISFSQLRCSSFRKKALEQRLRFGTHSPGRLRVIGSVQNSQEFAKAFNCPRDSGMNPSKKCSVW